MRQITVIDPITRKKKRIGVYIQDIVFIEEMTAKSCNIVIRMHGKDLVYECPKSFQAMYNLKHFSHMGPFIEN